MGELSPVTLMGAGFLCLPLSTELKIQLIALLHVSAQPIAANLLTISLHGTLSNVLE